MVISERIRSQKKDLETLPVDYRVRTKKLILDQSSLITVITGPRRAGKSTFVIEGLKDLRPGYANFDDELLTTVDNYDEIISAIDQVYSSPGILFFDEIQNLPKWELFVNRLQRQGRKLVITGSNSNLLSGELATHLTGRYIPVNIFPFSFTEFLTVDPNSTSIGTIQNELMKYLQSGGFPEVVTGKQLAGDYLRVLHDAIIFKDIVRRYSLRKFDGLTELAKYLVNNSATEFSDTQLSSILNLSVHTIKKYFTYLENAFLFFHLDRFSFKVRERLRYNRKIYVFDTGFMSSLSTQFSPNYGKYFETVVAIALRKEALDGKCEVFFYRNSQNEEVDFVVQTGLEITDLIQVAYSTDNPKTLEREIRSLLKAKKELKCENLTLINSSLSEVREYSWFGITAKVNFIRLDEWLLNRGG